MGGIAFGRVPTAGVDASEAGRRIGGVCAAPPASIKSVCRSDGFECTRACVGAADGARTFSSWSRVRLTSSRCDGGGETAAGEGVCAKLTLGDASTTGDDAGVGASGEDETDVKVGGDAGNGGGSCGVNGAPATTAASEGDNGVGVGAVCRCSMLGTAVDAAPSLTPTTISACAVNCGGAAAAAAAVDVVVVRAVGVAPVRASRRAAAVAALNGDAPVDLSSGSTGEEGCTVHPRDAGAVCIDCGVSRDNSLSRCSTAAVRRRIAAVSATPSAVSASAALPRS